MNARGSTTRAGSTCWLSSARTAERRRLSTIASRDRETVVSAMLPLCGHRHVVVAYDPDIARHRASSCERTPSSAPIATMSLTPKIASTRPASRIARAASCPAA